MSRVRLITHSYTYNSALNATHYLVTLLPDYMFRPHKAIIRCFYVAKIVALYLKIALSRVNAILAN
jgi:hypothetical protein